MSISVSYPGVYIDEDTTPAISISTRPTAVPIIPVFGWGYSVVKFNNYLEFVQYVRGLGKELDSNGFWNVRAYFECGGGACYVTEHDSLIGSVPKYDDITLIVACGKTDITSSSVRDLCAPGTGRFAVLDGPSDEITDSTAAKDYDAISGAAVYYPGLSVNWTTNTIAASAVVAGLYCAVDRTRGVWKAPANVALPSNYKPIYKVSDDLQGQYNREKAINMIRTLDNRGPVVWGARTLEDSDDWRYVPVRRLFDSAERDIKTSMQAMVFEPNNQPTWERVRGAIANYLYSLWRSGALLGSTETEAYFVKIGEGITMTPEDVAQGRLIISVGMAAVRPAEFIVLNFTQSVGQG
ncbi:phage tail sheath family protein [Paraburkholderia sp. GAS348]|uniref:phage tail sheath family protein n=1 Tax=Paraburkholderia sp. GAS348 TaxID=3035132 RepID=UPI003D241D9E